MSHYYPRQLTFRCMYYIFRISSVTCKCKEKFKYQINWVIKEVNKSIIPVSGHQKPNKVTTNVNIITIRYKSVVTTVVQETYVL